jgi:cytochrome oxidase Cu insertion factor (SCO1/SenC/PrrC family)
MKTLAMRIVPLFLCCAALSVFGLGKGERPAVVGNLLQQPMRAADFTLTDQHGSPFHMADAKGKVVLLSFIYTHCTDICPFIAMKVKDAYALLGADADKVVLVAVTTDPKRDVPSVTAAYSKEVGLFDVWHFVDGAPAAVQAVWADYAIGVTTDPGTAAAVSKEPAGASTAPDSDAPTQGLSKPDVTLAGAIASKFGGGYEVGHSAPFLLVDTKGMIQIAMDADATPADIVTNLRALLRAR